MKASLYQAMSPQSSRDDLVMAHAGLVKKIAHHLRARLPSSVLLDDLIQAGMIGLIEAARNFDGGKGASFETYAGIRIRGAMLDEVRRGDWVPRSVYRNSRRLAEAIRVLEIRLGREAQDHEIAEEMQLSLEDYHELVQDSRGSRLFSLDELLDAQSGELGSDEWLIHAEQPDRVAGAEQLKQHMVAAIKNLSEKEQLVLALYYDEQLNLKEIGAVLGVSESRVSQIHSQAALRLRSRLQDWQ